MTTPTAPPGLRAAGRRLWAAVLGDYELDEHELALLRQACRVLDTCDGLQRLADRDGLLVDGRVHPALVELRQQRILAARLITALRVPLGDADQPSKHDPVARLQRRGMRGVYGPRGVA